MKASAAIFDMDGTLVDSERVLMSEWLSAARALGHPLSAEDYAQVIGLEDEASTEILISLLGGAAAFGAVRARVRTALDAASGDLHFPLKSGVRQVLASLRKRSIPCAVASSSSAAEIQERLSRAAILGDFTATAGGDEVPRGKPDPAVYRLAASRLGIPPDRCLAFEDSTHGAAAATAAGARVVIVPDVRMPTEQMLKSVFMVLPTLADAMPRLDDWFGPCRSGS